MAPKRKRIMGKYTSKILGVAVYLSFISTVNILYADGGMGFSNMSDGMTAEMKNFIKPKYEEKTHLLQYVLMGAFARTEGALIRVTDARVEFIGADGKSVAAVLTSPEVFYNQSTQFLTGDKPVHYRSEGFDADGVGFDASQISESLHLRKDVKIIIRSLKQKSYNFALDINNSDTQRVTNLNGRTDTPAAGDSELKVGVNKE